MEDDKVELVVKEDDDEGLCDLGAVSDETKGSPLGHFMDVGNGYMF